VKSGLCFRESELSTGLYWHKLIIGRISNLIGCASRVRIAFVDIWRFNAPMADVHRLILDHGLNTARSMAADKKARAIVDAAASFMGAEDRRLGLTHAGWAYCCLPHKDNKEASWAQHGNKVSLVVQSGLDRDRKPVGIPYGATARLVLLYLQSEAIKTNSREIELGKSMGNWLTNLGLSDGGKTYKIVHEQSRRISACQLSFLGFDEKGEEVLRMNGAFVEQAITFRPGDSRQEDLWRETVTLNDVYFQSLKRRAVPLQQAAIAAISNRSMSLDVYTWLAYRLHALGDTTTITWNALHQQFGAGFKELRKFRVTFSEALRFAMAVYPEAKVRIEGCGLSLFPSPPPVARKSFQIVTGGLEVPPRQ
jgi:hypothetical protein